MRGKYSESFKETMVQKMSGPDAKSATALAGEVAIPQGTLSRKGFREYGRFGSTGDRMNKKKRPQNWTAEDKLKALIVYEGKNEDERGQYLRSHGLYSVDIDRWRGEVLESLNKKSKKGKNPRDRRIRELEGELRRKEKALA